MSPGFLSNVSKDNDFKSPILRLSKFEQDKKSSVLEQGFILIKALVLLLFSNIYGRCLQSSPSDTCASITLLVPSNSVIFNKQCDTSTLLNASIITMASLKS